MTKANETKKLPEGLAAAVAKHINPPVGTVCIYCIVFEAYKTEDGTIAIKDLHLMRKEIG